MHPLPLPFCAWVSLTKVLTSTVPLIIPVNSYTVLSQGPAPGISPGSTGPSGGVWVSLTHWAVLPRTQVR